MKIKICGYSLFPSWLGEGLISTPVKTQTNIDTKIINDKHCSKYNIPLSGNKNMYNLIDRQVCLNFIP